MLIMKQTNETSHYSFPSFAFVYTHTSIDTYYALFYNYNNKNNDTYPFLASTECHTVIM